jgi:hypothetical protein
VVPEIFALVVLAAHLLYITTTKPDFPHASTTSQHRNIATPQHRNTATPQHRNTATPN